MGKIVLSAGTVTEATYDLPFTLYPFFISVVTFE